MAEPSDRELLISKKRLMRKRIIEKRGAIPETLRAEKSSAVCAKLAALFGMTAQSPLPPGGRKDRMFPNLAATEADSRSVQEGFSGAECRENAATHGGIPNEQSASPRKKPGIGTAARIICARNAAAPAPTPVFAAGDSQRPVIAVYAAFDEELNLGEFIETCFACGAQAAFPCMNIKNRAGGTAHGLPMYMRIVDADSWHAHRAPFVEKPLARFGENDEALAGFPVASPQDIDAVVVPLVAFDETCRRLGYGGGNYDSYLERLSPSCAVVGVGFREQLVDAVPTEPHDIPLPAILFA